MWINSGIFGSGDFIMGDKSPKNKEKKKKKQVIKREQQKKPATVSSVTSKN
jgi:hypothetical protein